MFVKIFQLRFILNQLVYWILGWDLHMTAYQNEIGWSKCITCTDWHFMMRDLSWTKIVQLLSDFAFESWNTIFFTFYTNKHGVQIVYSCIQFPSVWFPQGIQSNDGQSLEPFQLHLLATTSCHLIASPVRNAVRVSPFLPLFIPFPSLHHQGQNGVFLSSSGCNQKPRGFLLHLPTTSSN